MQGPEGMTAAPATQLQAWGDAGKPQMLTIPDSSIKNKSDKGCWAQFSQCVGGMWATRTMSKREDKEVYVRTTLRELVIYLLFLCIMCIITFGMTSHATYYFTTALNALFLDTPYPDTRNSLRGSTTILDFWRFMEKVLPNTLFCENWYDAKQTQTSQDDRNILYENRMLGVARMRQIRVRNNSCTVPDDFSRVIRNCYDVYSPQDEDKDPFGPMNGTAWVYYTQEELQGTSYWGKLGTYSGAGSYIDFAATQAETNKMIAQLKQLLWVNRGTRAVFVDFTVYNANINLFCVVKLLIEFPAVGGIVPSWSFKSLKLLRYVSPWDYFVLACEFLFVFFTCYYVVEEILEISKVKAAYFKQLWNIIDVLVVILSVICIVFNIFCVLTIGNQLDDLLKYPDKYANFEYLSFWQDQFNTIAAMCVFFAWFKLFKYISFNKTMTQLSCTLSRSARDVAGFAVMFFIVFFAFAQLGYLLFGTQVKDFSTFVTANFSLLRTILGDFNFQDIEEANRILGPIFFLSYVFFVFLVLLNMFLAIINDTYSEVKSDISLQKSEFEIADYFKRGYNNMLGKFGMRDKLIDVENALKLSDHNDDGLLAFDEVRKTLKRCNFSDMEIEMFFARYDIDGDKYLEADEIKHVLSDLQGRRNDTENKIIPLTQHERPRSVRSARQDRRPGTGNPGQFVSGVAQDEFLVLTRRVDHMEHSIGSIVNKIDVVLLKLDSMEKSKSKKKETMGKLMDDILETHDSSRQTLLSKLKLLTLEELEHWDIVMNKPKKIFPFIL